MGYRVQWYGFTCLGNEVQVYGAQGYGGTWAMGTGGMGTWATGHMEQ